MGGWWNEMKLTDGTGRRVGGQYFKTIVNQERVSRRFSRAQNRTVFHDHFSVEGKPNATLVLHVTSQFVVCVCNHRGDDIL